MAESADRQSRAGLRNDGEAVMADVTDLTNGAFIGYGAQFFLGGEEKPQARCDYCGLYGDLGRCEGCGAPNEPQAQRIDATSLCGSRTIPARRPETVQR